MLVAEIRRFEMHDKMYKMVEVMVLMGTGQVELHTARRFRRIYIYRVPVDHQVVLLSTSLISILSPIVAISISSRIRPPRPRALPLPPPLDLQTAKTTQRAAA